MNAHIIPSLFVASAFALSQSAADAASNSVGEASARIRIEVNEPDSLTATKPLRISVQETDRDERTSTMLVRFESGASVASAMLIMHAVWQIARARGDRYAMVLADTNVSGGRESVIGFCKERRDDYVQYFNVASRAGARDKLEWLDMNRFDVVWQRTQQ